MRSIASRYNMLVLSFGSLLINTMPVWVAALTDENRVSDSVAGLLGSLVLLAASLACGAARYVARPFMDRLAPMLVPAGLVSLATAKAAPLIVTVLSCAMLGLSLGLLTARALSGVGAGAKLQRAIASALAMGLIAALVVYLLLPVSGVDPLWLLSALSLLLLIGGSGNLPEGRNASLTATPVWSGFPVFQFPFFVMMGAYWSFLEIFAGSIAFPGALSFWLLGSLLTGALGSALAAAVVQRQGHWLASGALICAAATGALSYLSTDIVFLGLMVLTNGFFLFLYFPFYLSGREHKEGAAAKRMAVYLFGFALGGAVGAGLLSSTGFVGLALAIALSGIIGLLRRHPPDQS
ncbi:hypothetical protein KX928_14805 [Roseobacter sp. YSTF-M11]|uniref:Uncharacterized protein n=1 Tax=Roseobacter insulae TaxID=2859783 RepID=A0A9X1FY46_9RHOB|nr:hypothetical protein [Roseobacter insulae]MBW4709058.1 hypothetical protein [Roseobacter insulae]